MDALVYVIDTHPLVWYYEDSRRLSSSADRVFQQIEQGDAVGLVPTIVLAEIMHLRGNGRIRVSVDEIISRIEQSTNLSVASLDLDVIQLMIPLRDFEIHDRVIVATAKSFEASLITKDEHIQKSGAVSCVW